MIKNKVLRSGLILLLLIQSFSELFAQPANDSCETATVIDNVQSDFPFVCIEGTNLAGTPEPFNNNCSIGDFSTVWFQVPTDGDATLMNIQVTTSDFDAPTISLFLLATDCTELQPIPLGPGNSPCIVGTNGEAEASGTEVGGSQIYYIAVSSLNSVGGEFQICVNTISQASVCVLDRNIEITSRSFGGSLSGPFFPGERIGICMNVNSFTAASNGCQWFQGIVPVFGNGWDPSSFDANGQPLNATVNGNSMGVAGNGLYGTATWDWFSDVDYHFDNPFPQVGDLDGNGTLDMCHLLYDADCPDFGGLTGACCGPCWGTPIGSILPPGWFAYGINGTCPTPGPPVSVDWGDGNTCGGGMGPWNFCFELTIRAYPDCIEDPTTSDLGLGFFTFADGEVGSWTGSASVCALDQPVRITPPMCCNQLDTAAEDVNTICTGGIFSYVIDEPNVDYWIWTVDAGSVTGATGGQGGPGSTITDTLVNDGSDTESVEYLFLGFAGGACPVFQKIVTINVNPALNANLTPLVFCSSPNMYTIVPQISGGSGNYSYIWLPGGETTSTLTVMNPTEGTQYFLTVSDESGCSDQASTTITFGDSLAVEIIAPVTQQCLQDGSIAIEAISNGGVPPLEFTWTLPDGSVIPGNSIDAVQTGLYTIEISDSEGCSGSDSVHVTLNEEPVVTVAVEGGTPVICGGETLTLNANVTGGESPYIYSWSTPNGAISGPAIEASIPGLYFVMVEDNNGCTGLSSVVFVESTPLPFVDLGPDSIMVSGSTTLDAGGPWASYSWNTGANSRHITVNTPGTYIACVTDINGCVGCDTIYVEIITNTIDLSNSGYLNIFPNPSNGRFMVSGELKVEEEIGITVSNTIGQNVYTSFPENVGTKISKEIDLGKVAPGVYYLQVMIGREGFVRKIVVE